MHQFDVYKNPSSKTSETYPYIVDVQNNVLQHLATRLVVPLTSSTARPNMLFRKLTPIIEFREQSYLFVTQQLTAVPIDSLHSPIGSLISCRARLLDAIDFAITGV